MTTAKWLWLLVAALALVVLQIAIADELSVMGVHAELIWVLPVAAGLAAGPMAGMSAGLMGGVVADLFQPTPFGLTALVAVVIGYALGRLGEEGVGDLGGAAWWVAPALAAAAGLVAPLAYALCAAALGHTGYLTAVPVGMVCVLDALACALLVRPTMRLIGPRLAGDARAGALEPVRGMV